MRSSAAVRKSRILTKPLRRRPQLELLEDRTCPSLVLALGMNEGTGTSALDISGNNNHGTLSGATWSTSGKYGGALSFDGVNDWLTIADANSLDLTSGMTLEAWVNPTTINGWETVLLKEAGTDLSYGLYGDNNGNDSGGPRRPAGYIQQGGGSYATTGTSQLAVGQWTHLAATYDGAALRLYVDAIQVGTLSRTGNISTSTGALRIGGNNIWSEWFGGRIDEIRVYNHALTQAEIQSDMNTPITAGPDLTPPTITSTSPSAGATGVNATANVTMTFSEAMDAATISASSIELRDSVSATVPAAISFDAVSRTATIDPVATLTPGDTYSVLIRGGATDPRVKDLAGNALVADVSWSFTIAPLSLSISDITVAEGNAGSVIASFVVSLSSSSSQTVSVTYATGGGTATPDSDYISVSPTTLTFDPGEVTKSIQVTVNGDAVGEANETFFVNLSSPVNTVLGDAQGIGTINDDDGLFIGSEGFGYSAYSNSFEAIDLIPGAAGVFTIRATGNNNADLVTLTSGNSFSFYGTSYTSFYVSTNGLISFGSSNTAAANTNLTSSPTQRVIAPMWDDWVNVTGQAMLLGKYEDTTGDSAPDRLIIEWNNVQGNTSSPSPVTFQAILQLNTGIIPGEFTFNYPDLDAGNAVSNGGSATVGIKDSGTQGVRRLLVSFNSASSPYLGSGRAIKFKPDTVPPVVTMTSPADGSIVTGTIGISATATDNIAIAGVQFLLVGANLGAEDTSAPYSMSWNTTSAAAGVHTLTARGRDTSGNLTSVSRTVTVVPQLQIMAPVEGASVNGPAITVTYTMAGDLIGAGADHVHFQVDGVTTLMDLTLDGTYQLNDLTAGPHTLSGVFARANHTEITGTQTPLIHFTVTAPDTTPPAVSITSPNNGASLSGTIAVTAGATDDVGVVGVQFYLDGNPLGSEDTAAPYSINWNTSSVSSGAHNLTARARDAAGNTTLSTPIAITVVNGSSPEVVGQWSSVMNWPLVAMNTVLLKDGRVLMWDGGPACIGSSSARVWDPQTNTFTPVPIPYFSGHNDDIFCSGQALLADGRVLVVGGHDCDGPELGIRMVNIFNPVTMTWTQGPDMAYRRWYPTATTLSDGRVLVTAGSVNSTTDYVPIPEIYDPVSNSWTTLSSANRTIPNYPFVFQTPDGNVLVAGSDEAKMATFELNVATQTWTTVDSSVLDAGSAVMYRPGQVMKAGSSYLSAPADNGGGVPSLATTYVMDALSPAPLWQQTASMAYPRTHLTLTMLPDGNVLATGGSTDIGGVNTSNAVYPAELWSPTTRVWSTMASMQRPRMYHSTALLLPDGRIMVAGSGHNYFNSHAEFNAELYSPAYLFKGARPTIASVPTTLTYGTDFFVGTPDGASIASVALIRNGSATHAFNMDQRFVPLTFTQTTGGLTVQAPTDSVLASPGHYMLFIVNSNGVPSVAPFVRLPAPYEDAVPPSAPTNLAATGGLGSASLTWTASTDNLGVAGYNIHRSTSANFTVGAANQVGQTSVTSFSDTGLPANTYYYQVVARDAAGNLSSASNEASAVVTADNTLPTVIITAPSDGVTVSGVITVTANAADDVAVAGVQFFLDGSALGSEDTTSPFSTSWNTAGVTNGSHTLTARARDTSSNTAFSTAVTVTVNNTASNGLVLALGMNEGTGTTTADASGSNNHGTLSGATWSASGKYGGALSFDGINDWLTIADANSLDLTSGMTLEAWVNPTTINGWETVLLKEAGTDLSYALYGDNNGNDSGGPRRPAAYIRQGGGSYTTTGTAQLAVGQWTHLAATYDGSSLRLYVNAAQVGTLSRTGNISTSTGALRIGGNNIWSEWFGGRIDEVRVYNRALTQVEIQTDMNTPIGGGLLEARTSPLHHRQVPLLDRRMAEPLRLEAIRRWQTAGISPEQTALLQSASLTISDLPGRQLGSSVGAQLFIDLDGAGHGWFIDSTPSVDREFSTSLGNPARGKIDLLTVLAHEMGHVLGLDHSDAADDLMASSLPTGVRRIETAPRAGRNVDSTRVHSVLSDAQLARTLVDDQTRNTAQSTRTLEQKIDPAWLAAPSPLSLHLLSMEATRFPRVEFRTVPLPDSRLTAALVDRFFGSLSEEPSPLGTLIFKND